MLNRDPEPPVAPVRPRRLKAHGHIRVDPYHWLRDRDSAETLDWLKAENAYADAVLAPTRELQETLVEEFRTRIRQTDQSVPFRLRGYLYYVRTVEGLDYPIYCRRAGGETGPEEILLDVNKAAAGHAYFDVGALEVSPDNDLLAWAVDTEGRRLYDVSFRRLSDGELLPDRLEGITDNIVWAEDGRTLLYTRQHPDTLRWHQVWRHRLGTAAAEDRLVFEEEDETFSVEVEQSRSRDWLLICSEQTVATECRLLDAHRPDGPLQLFCPRSRGHEYTLDHFADRFWVLTNHEAVNFRLQTAPEPGIPVQAWTDVVPHREDVLLEGFELFDSHLVLEERCAGRTLLRVTDLAGAGGKLLDFEEADFTVGLGHNPEPDQPAFRFAYTSMTTPTEVYDCDFRDGSRQLLKRDEVGGKFSPSDYESGRLDAPGSGGVRIPVSLVGRRPLQRGEPRPLLLYGYGAYGMSLDPTFSAIRLSLLDRGFLFAIAHVRGGQELGRRWYDEGRLSAKQNTFDDFIACAGHLIEAGYTAPDRLFAWGGSAGGLLMGAVANQAPQLFAGLVAEAPFVDIVTTMLDTSVPLTTGEYDEWGNPAEREAFERMLAYSPYDNVTAQDYPPMLVTTAVADSQVQYWEPAKWVARLRATKTDGRPVLLKTDLETGHTGATARTKRYRETAEIYAFLIALADPLQPR